MKICKKRVDAKRTEESVIKGIPVRGNRYLNEGTDEEYMNELI